MKKRKLPEFANSEKELNELLEELYEIDGYLAGAIKTNKTDLIKRGIKLMKHLLKKINKLETNALEKKEAINYIEESIILGKNLNS